MAHDSTDRPGLLPVETVGRIQHTRLEWDDPAPSPVEVESGGAHPLFVSGVGRPLEWEPSTPHRLASPLTDQGRIGGLR